MEGEIDIDLDLDFEVDNLKDRDTCWDKLLHATVYFLTFLLLFVSHFTQVLECSDM